MPSTFEFTQVCFPILKCKYVRLYVGICIAVILYCIARDNAIDKRQVISKAKNRAFNFNAEKRANICPSSSYYQHSLISRKCAEVLSRTLSTSKIFSVLYFCRTIQHTSIYFRIRIKWCFLFMLLLPVVALLFLMLSKYT